MGNSGDTHHSQKREVDRAIAIIKAHPQVNQVSDSYTQDDVFHLDVILEVPMPNAWRAIGESPSGVRRFEEIHLEFPRLYPLDPPELSLRADFSRNHAHIQPWLTSDKRPVPCIQDGQLTEFMQQHGIAGIVNQTVLWLEHAAEGRLIDPEQGWEPQRRDDTQDFLVAGSSSLRAKVSRNGGFRFNRMGYFRRHGHWLFGQVFNDQIPVNEKSIQKAVTWTTHNEEFQRGDSLALIVWPGKQPSGDPIVCDVYVPDNVKNLSDLKEKAREFGCIRELTDGLNRLAQCVKKYRSGEACPIGVVLCARRPCNIIGTTSNIEICCYTLDFYANEAFPNGDDTPVRPCAHRDQITRELLSTLSGLPPEDTPPTWTLIGAGSLGSKIALHLGRAGRGPSTIIDSAMMAPHNAARHAIIPAETDKQIMLMDMKARLLKEALAGLSQNVTAITDDIVDVFHSRALSKHACHNDTWAIVNTTASLRARAALCTQTFRHRVIEALLYANGSLGVIATEGANRNPDIGDIFTELYALASGDDKIRQQLYPEGGDIELQRIVVGEGCGSATMQVSDGRISMYAAGMSEYLLSRQQEGLPTEGELLIGRLSGTGIGVSWEHVPVAPVCIVRTENETGWKIRLSARAHEKIEREVAHWTSVETGGVLLGRQDEVTRSFYVIDVLAAPEDSQRSRHKFVLGVKDLRRTLDNYVRITNATLYCLGTWHSHLAPSGPSALDNQSAQAMGLARLAPSILLIHTPDGYRAVLAERENGEGSMNLTELVTDPYNRRARLQPALLALLPVGIVALIFFPGLESKAATLIGVAAYFGGATWLTQVGRARGKRLESKLFQSWGGMPSSSMLRHRDKRLNKLTKERYHSFLSTHIQNIDLPSSEGELNDPETADEVYASANDWLLQTTRDQESAKLIFEENMNYGFRRNFWALRPMALLVDLVLAAVVVVLIVPLQSSPFSIMELNTATLVTLAVIVVHILVVLGATKKWVLAAAEAYARQLLSACDALNDKRIKG